MVALSFVPPAIAGLALERRIEALGTPAATAAGLVAGSVAMVVADRAPQDRGHGDAGAARRPRARARAGGRAGPRRLAERGNPHRRARARRFSRDQANLLSRTVALPVIVGAVALKGARLRRRGIAPGTGRTLAIGAAAAFASTLASQRLINLVERDRALWPYAAYRDRAGRGGRRPAQLTVMYPAALPGRHLSPPDTSLPLVFAQ